jgi:hypothetical protein
MADLEQMSWQVPYFEVPAEKRAGWVEEQLQEGEGWLQDQRSYKDLARNLKVFDGIIDDGVASSLVTNGLKYDIRKFIETISEVREIGSYSTDAVQYKSFSTMVNKVTKGIYLEAAFPRSVRKALQFSAVMGRGYIWPKVKTAQYGFGERQLIFEPLGLLDVIPVQIPSTNDVQDAYSVTVFEYMPIAEAHARFPLFQGQLKPISDVSYKNRVQCKRADLAQRFRYGQNEARTWGDLYCEIRYTFVRDIRINTTGHELPMGDLNTSWFYKVPYVGQSIIGGIKDGSPYMRPARMEDCRIYPQLREIITSPSVAIPMYDGPAFDWHGVIPPVQYDVDDWAWEPIGRSLVSDVGSIEVTKRKLERRMDQVVRTTLNPPMGYDRTAQGGPTIENFDIFGQDQRIGLEGEPKKMLQSVLPDEVRVEEVHFKFLDVLTKMREQQLGIQDLGNLANLKFNISGETMDKALEEIGPIAKGIAAGMEAANAKVAFQLKTMIIQWYDTKRVIQIIGADNITAETFDFDPASIVPSHMPEEMVPATEGNQTMWTHPTMASIYDKMERAKRFSSNLRLISVPSTLLKITQRDEQQKLILLKKMGAPIPWAFIMPKIGIENFGDVKGNTVFEQWMNEEIEMLKVKAAAAQLAAALGLGGGEGGPGQGKGGGRPNSMQKPPKTAQKGGAGGEPRVVQKTS